MKSIKLLLVLLLLLVFTASVSDVAVAKGGRGHFRSHLGFSFAFGPYWGPWGPWYNSYPVVVVERETPVYYIEKSTADASQAPQDNYWYFCSASEGYYPYVKECPGGWQLVPPRPAGLP